MRSRIKWIFLLLSLGWTLADQTAKKELAKLRTEFDERLTALYEYFEQRYLDVMDVNEVRYSRNSKFGQ